MGQKSLEELVIERKQLARQNNIFEKALAIASAFEKLNHGYYIEKTRYTERRWLKERFSVLLKEYHAVEGHPIAVSIFSDKKLVFYQQRYPNLLTTYIPGTWENHLNELYPSSQKRLKERRRDKAQLRDEAREREAALRENFGLY